MMSLQEFKELMRNTYALKERDAQLATVIAEHIRNTMDLIERMPPSVLEALLKFSANPDAQADLPKERKGVRDAYRDFIKYALRGAEETEHKLYCGLTGRENDE
jgi:hypothetical protein